MDEQNTNLPDDSEFLKSLEADHIADAHYEVPDFSDTDKTQIFRTEDLKLPESKPEAAPVQPEAPAPAAPEVPEEAPAAEGGGMKIPPRRKKPETGPTIAGVNPRYFREVVLPLGICAVAALFCLVFIAGAVSHRVRANKEIKAANIAASNSMAEESKRIYDEYAALLLQAEEAANGCDYETAVALLDSFSGSTADYPDLLAVRNRYAEELSRMVVWNDPAQVLNLSFHVLIADASRAFADEEYGSSYQENFITTDEFSRILNQLYENGYMLVDFDDIIQTVTNSDGSVGYAARPLYLPTGKKPLMLTETNANYYTYMVDSDEDGIADQGGAGFASRLIVDASGNLTNELIDANGNTVTGAFDMVPILEEFIKAHPDFSYRNARAIIATSGYDGVVGYRINKSAQETLGAAAYNMEVAQAKKVAQALIARGYKLACYTYDNIDYNEETTANIQIDLHYWTEEIVPVIGATDILVYARNSDISDISDYSGDKYDLLKKTGFNFFLGVGSTSKWASVNKDNVRQFRMTVTGDQLLYTPEKYSDLFDASSVLSEVRP